MRPFSVLMSLYARETQSIVRECLESLEAQDRQPDQVVVVEDGPIQPGVESLLSDWAQRLPLCRVKLQSNVGLGLALNAGLAVCGHEYVARMDADDVAMPGRFARQLAVMEARPELSIVGGQIEEFDEAGGKGLLRSVPLVHAAIQRRALLRNPVNHMTVLFRKSAVLAVGGYRDLPGYEDYELWLRCLAAGLLFENLPDVLVRARTGRGFAGRRRGWRHAGNEIELGKAKYRARLWSRAAVVGITFLRAIARIAPGPLITFVYRAFLRSR